MNGRACPFPRVCVKDKFTLSGKSKLTAGPLRPNPIMLPVDEVLDELATTLADHNRAVLIAPPGAGKTTRVAPFLLSAGWLSNKKILLLEPRRLAARAAAHRMAEEMGQSPGEVTGYRIRLETKISARTRIEVLTEGILTRMFQNDPELPAAGMIIFDEFHERSMHADLGLALALEVQQTLRPDLRILCMSATLDASRLSSVLNAPVIRSEGKLFSVSVRYAGFSRDPVHVSASRAVRQAMQSEGDILVFLPGAGEIHRTAELVEADLGSARVLPLYGDLSDREQKSALEPDPGGRRKVILSTNIAETSLTIEGVRTVIDSGLERRLRFDPASGLSALELSRISRASADQRAGRAGRTAPGQCIRLYDEEEYRRMKPAIIPEILESDPSGLILEMAKWGSDESSLAFLDSPPRANLDQARALLRDLGALDSENRITQVGEAFVGLPVHPRIARMLLQCPASMLDAACDLAAVFGERDVFRHEGADLGRRLDLLRQGTARHVLRVAEDLRRTARALRDRSLAAISFAPARGEEAGFLAMLAYPDRIGALRRGSSNRYLLTSGRGAVLDEKDPLCGSPFLVCALLDDRPGDARIRLAARTGEAALRAVYGDRIEIREESAVEQGRPVRRTIEALGALVLSSAVETLEDPDLLLGEIKRTTLADFWNSEMENIAVRAALARSLGFEFPDCSRETLCANAEEWLGPFLSGMKSLNEAKAIDARLALETWLGREKTRLLAELFPESISVPSGSKIRLEYSEKEVVLPVKLQELFGLTATPTVARGRLPVTLHLLSPAKRPIQITQDLSGFWQRTYPEVRKELRGRYPRHPWPEDPMTEPPARGVKKRPQ